MYVNCSYHRHAVFCPLKMCRIYHQQVIESHYRYVVCDHDRCVDMTNHIVIDSVSHCSVSLTHQLVVLTMCCCCCCCCCCVHAQISRCHIEIVCNTHVVWVV